MKSIHKLVLTAIMSALCYVTFTFIQIKIPTPAGYTSFHLGNAFCVLAALLIDGVSGGIAGAIGMGIGDLLDPAYVITAPKTIFLKFFIGFITGTIAHKVFHIKELNGKQLFKATVISCLCGMAFNMLGEPLISYLYYNLILNNSSKALSYLTAAKFITTAVNGILSIIIASLLYIPASKRLNRFIENYDEKK